MDLLQSVRSHSSQPLTRQLLTSLLKNQEYSSDKINELVSMGLLDNVRDGLYLPTKQLSPFRPEPFLFANHLFGPSYVSLDSALSYYGLIPERVFETTSATTKASMRFDTSAGAFSFTHLPLPYFSFGICQMEVAYRQNVLMALPEKALFDKVVSARGLRLTGIKTTIEYLIENLRIDKDDLIKLDTELMKTWLNDAPKRESLALIVKLIEGLS